MAEIRDWANGPEGTGLVNGLRLFPGVQSLELSFCPGEGWLAARYVFTDLEGMKAFPEHPFFFCRSQGRGLGPRALRFSPEPTRVQGLPPLGGMSSRPEPGRVLALVIVVAH